MNDSSDPPARPESEERTSDKGGDSDPDTNEGFKPPDQRRDPGDAGHEHLTRPKTSIDDFGSDEAARPDDETSEPSEATGEAQAEENRERESPS